MWRLKHWSTDSDEFAAWVVETMEADAIQADWEYYGGDPFEDDPGLTLAELQRSAAEGRRSKEKQAVAVADYRVIEELIRPPDPEGYGDEWVRNGRRRRTVTLYLETWDLIADRLIGKARRGKGRLRLSEEERRAQNPIHDAVDDVRPIQAFLHRHFPEKSSVDTRDRAIAVAAWKHKVEVNTLENHLRRPKADHRRVTGRRRTGKPQNQK